MDLLLARTQGLGVLRAEPRGGKGTVRLLLVPLSDPHLTFSSLAASGSLKHPFAKEKLQS